ncbi:unnamed protein product, partial [Prorocentrum cordatum]
MLTRASVVHEADTQRTQSVEKNQCSTLHAEKHPTHLHSRRTPAHVHPAGAVAGAVKRAPRKASPELGVRFHARGCSSRLRACIGFGKKAVEKGESGGEGRVAWAMVGARRARLPRWRRRWAGTKGPAAQRNSQADTPPP